MAAVKTRKTKADKGAGLVVSVLGEPNPRADGGRSWRATDLAKRASVLCGKPVSREQVGGTLRLQLVPKGLAEPRRVGRHETVWQLTEKVCSLRAFSATPPCAFLTCCRRGCKPRRSEGCCETHPQSCRTRLGTARSRTRCRVKRSERRLQARMGVGEKHCWRSGHAFNMRASLPWLPRGYEARGPQQARPSLRRHARAARTRAPVLQPRPLRPPAASRGRCT